MSFKNLPGFKKRLKKRLVTNTEDNAEELVTRACLLVEGRVVDSIMRDPKTGRDRGDGSTASAPGQAPAQDEGKLSGSITFNVTKDKRGVVGQIIQQSNQAPYGSDLEFGTTNIEPRPFMQPALESQAGRIIKMFKKGGLIK